MEGVREAGGQGRTQAEAAREIDGNIAMSARADVEIDYCPTCRGIWLDM